MRGSDVHSGRPFLRVVATSEAIDRIVSENPEPQLMALRVASDELIIRDPGDLAERLAIGDAYAIVERELGLTAMVFEGAEFDRIVRAHIEWPWNPPSASTPAVAQGLVAGVPCTIWCGVASPFEGSEPHYWIVCPTAYAHELEDRLR